MSAEAVRERCELHDLCDKGDVKDNLQSVDFHLNLKLSRKGAAGSADPSGTCQF